MSLAWRADGGYAGVALLDVETAGRKEGTLRMPEGSRLVAVRVAGIPVSPEAAGRHRWKLTFFPSDLPERVEVVFDGVLAGADVPGVSAVRVADVGGSPCPPDPLDDFRPALVVAGKES